MSDQSVPRQSGPGESPRSVSGRGHRFEAVLSFAPLPGWAHGQQVWLPFLHKLLNLVLIDTRQALRCHSA
ncbi:hypothetical protein SynBIOSU31_03145 [Synechococcus sp. BIOS-U3-1]|nr:hypothetical protein SynBIOSU31_03145 [Synechococcus sp. BIOS-U3-1]